jgi:hypothetical protein
VDRTVSATEHLVYSVKLGKPKILPQQQQAHALAAVLDITLLELVLSVVLHVLQELSQLLLDLHLVPFVRLDGIHHPEQQAALFVLLEVSLCLGKHHALLVLLDSMILHQDLPHVPRVLLGTLLFLADQAALHVHRELIDVWHSLKKSKNLYSNN